MACCNNPSREAPKTTTSKPSVLTNSITPSATDSACKDAATTLLCKWRLRINWRVDSSKTVISGAVSQGFTTWVKRISVSFSKVTKAGNNLMAIGAFGPPAIGTNHRLNCWQEWKLFPNLTKTTSQFAWRITVSTTLPKILPGVDVFPFQPMKIKSIYRSLVVSKIAWAISWATRIWVWIGICHFFAKTSACRSKRRLLVVLTWVSAGELWRETKIICKHSIS